MKKFRQVCMAGVFTLLLTTATFAGEIATGGFTAPPPPPPDELTATTPEEIQTGWGIQNWQATRDSVADISLNLLQTMLALF
jgi:hypothetical protein